MKRPETIGSIQTPENFQVIYPPVNGYKNDLLPPPRIYSISININISLFLDHLYSQGEERVLESTNYASPPDFYWFTARSFRTCQKTIGKRKVFSREASKK